MISPNSSFFFLLLFCSFIVSHLSAQTIHRMPTCATSSSVSTLKWGQSASAFDYTAGSTNYKAANVDGYGTNFTFEFSGDTQNLGTRGGKQTPFSGNALGKGLNLFVNAGGSDITLTISISPPVDGNIAFDFMHVNGSNYSGDLLTIAGKSSDGVTVYPTISSSPRPSYNVQGTNMNVIDASASSTDSTDAYAGVNFAAGNMISEITIRWQDCTTCGTGIHGVVLGDIDFCRTAGTVLPVELTSFDLTQTPEGAVQIDWETATEHNADYFEIEHSSNGTDWNFVAAMDAAGNSTTAQQYRAFSDDAVNGLNYYRLVEVDESGNRNAKEVKSITVSITTSVAIAPNPASTGQPIYLQGLDSEAFVTIYSANGAIAYSGLAQQSFTIDQAVSSGLHFYTIDGLNGERISSGSLVIRD